MNAIYEYLSDDRRWEASSNEDYYERLGWARTQLAAGKNPDIYPRYHSGQLGPAQSASDFVAEHEQAEELRVH